MTAPLSYASCQPLNLAVKLRSIYGVNDVLHDELIVRIIACGFGDAEHLQGHQCIGFPPTLGNAYFVECDELYPLQRFGFSLKRKHGEDLPRTPQTGGIRRSAEDEHTVT
eukprot:CAMPEP_0185755002 /NCGR_PEP_ID=MMETSP1174-20130828/13556_1 /TAXON_ID=35687 /ORGANISM="Dictyocha speculum, Strain CCMP1381" /LENGTH=109 /DNA_ID=CAMNT_0028433409 /DNA_START=143 /DNA_END=468 /DNA_ORIENTATION=+